MRIVTRVGECEVWLVDLRASDDRYVRALALLSDAERARARAIRGEQARRRFVLARAALRVRLADVLGIAPERVTLRMGEHGKPELAPAPLEGGLRLREHGKPELAALPLEGGPRVRAHGKPEITPALPGAGACGITPALPRAGACAARVSQGLPRFNLAHGDGVALLAISHRRDDVGVDIERIAPESERSWSGLLERICHPSEACEAIAEARAIGSRAFYERWVGKEAVLKALGVGLRISPAEVPLRRDDAGVLRVGELPGRRGPASGLLGAVFGLRGTASGLSGTASRLSGAAVADGCVTARADGDLAGCRLASVRTPAGFVGALALLAPVS
jgi:phosphopantetheinyl transferase